ncbi:Hypothetical protein CINCED_3A023569 [Cinara cedri]|uniref:Uncharacterized protein n=1 Tax=Cinara cedri TaxID=506608 RepID=A0A5E4NLG3_9HEMI|nr:Hypothetical protein CINCED_3A023569 [Cinara cedri]
MNVVMLFNILEDEADEKLLLLANHLRNENDEKFSQRSREGRFNQSQEEHHVNNTSLLATLPIFDVVT